MHAEIYSLDPIFNGKLIEILGNIFNFEIKVNDIIFFFITKP